MISFPNKMLSNVNLVHFVLFIIAETGTPGKFIFLFLFYVFVVLSIILHSRYFLFLFIFLAFFLNCLCILFEFYLSVSRASTFLYVYYSYYSNLCCSCSFYRYRRLPPRQHLFFYSSLTFPTVLPFYKTAYLNTTVCGSRPSVLPMIAGGAQVTAGWPWMGSIRVSWDVHICGIILIDTQWALTTRGCM